jgi:hypothetical protein
MIKISCDDDNKKTMKYLVTINDKPDLKAKMSEFDGEFALIQQRKEFLEAQGKKLSADAKKYHENKWEWIKSYLKDNGLLSTEFKDPIIEMIDGQFFYRGESGGREECGCFKCFMMKQLME